MKYDTWQHVAEMKCGISVYVPVICALQVKGSHHTTTRDSALHRNFFRGARIVTSWKTCECSVLHILLSWLFTWPQPRSITKGNITQYAHSISLDEPVKPPTTTSLHFLSYINTDAGVTFCSPLCTLRVTEGSFTWSKTAGV